MHTTKEAAAALEISPTTLAKYVIALEGAGFRFESGKRNARLFDEKEMATLRQMIDTAASQDLPPGQAAYTIGQNAYMSLIEDRLASIERRQEHLTHLYENLSCQLARLPAHHIPDYSPPSFFLLPRRRAGFFNFLSK